MINESCEEKISEIKSRAKQILATTDIYQYKGSVSKLLGLTVEVKLPGLKIGDLCYIETQTEKKNRLKLLHLKVKWHKFCFYTMEPE